MVIRNLLLVALALASAGCEAWWAANGDGADGPSAAETFTEPCVSGQAHHDFGTTDPATLARVRAWVPSGNGATDGTVTFRGSVATVGCGTDPVTFVVE